MSTKRFKVSETEEIIEELEKSNKVIIETGLGEIHICAVCVGGYAGKSRACQGSIKVKLFNGKELHATLKSGRILWHLGDLLEKNDVQDFIALVNLALTLTSIIKPIVDRALPPDTPQFEWGVEFSLFTRHYTLPPWARTDAPYETLSIEIRPRMFR